VANEHDRSGQGPQELGQVGGVTIKIAERVSESDGTESLTLQGADLRVEARRVGPGAVDEDDRWVSAGIVVAAPLLTVRDATLLPACARSQGLSRGTSRR
jgi:hypothetical protein